MRWTFLRRSPFGNQASLFTTSGAAARRFRYEAPAGNIGINIGVAAPMAYFPFSGWKESFFGILHGQGRDAVEFYTESKIVVERWSCRKPESSDGRRCLLSTFSFLSLPLSSCA